MGRTLIEIHPAYVFDCDECGKENFFRAVNMESNNFELDEEQKEMSEDGWEFKAVYVPEFVECEFCKARFEIGSGNNE